MARNIQAWINAGLEHKLNIHFTIEYDRLASIRKLISSGLATYRYDIMSIEEFMPKEYATPMVIRAIPKRTGIERYTYIGEELDSVKAKLRKLDCKDYTILANEYEEAQYCGVIISKPESLVIEMAQEPNLERLCHGEIVPWSAELSYTHHTPRMIYKNVDSKKIREMMYSVVKSISEIEQNEIPCLHPRYGYFEFVITDSIKFIDYQK